MGGFQEYEQLRLPVRSTTDYSVSDGGCSESLKRTYPGDQYLSGSVVTFEFICESSHGTLTRRFTLDLLAGNADQNSDISATFARLLTEEAQDLVT